MILTIKPDRRDLQEVMKSEAGSLWLGQLGKQAGVACSFATSAVNAKCLKSSLEAEHVLDGLWLHSLLLALKELLEKGSAPWASVAASAGGWRKESAMGPYVLLLQHLSSILSSEIQHLISGPLHRVRNAFYILGDTIWISGHILFFLPCTKPTHKLNIPTHQPLP